MALDGMAFCLTGNCGDLKDTITSNGGEIVSNVTAACTHLVYGETEKVFGSISGKGSTKYKTAMKKKIPCVDVAWVEAFITGGAKAASGAAKEKEKVEKRKREEEKEAKAAKAKKAKSIPKKVIDAEKKKWKEIEDGLYESAVGDLKEMLGANGQKKGGTKAELVERITDAKMYGCLPRCPKCSGGQLRVTYKGAKWGMAGQGSFSCPGYMDDTDFKSCDFTSESAERVPWVE